MCIEGKRDILEGECWGWEYQVGEKEEVHGCSEGGHEGGWNDGGESR